MPRAPGAVDPAVTPPHHGAVPSDDQFLGLESAFVRGVEELPDQRPDLDSTLVPFAVRSRRAVDQTVVGESGHRGIELLRVRDGKIAEKLAYVKG